MPSTIVELDPCTKEIAVSVSEERIRGALDKSYSELRAQIALPGFRPGKVPRSVLEKRFGDHVRHEVLHEIMKESMDEALKEFDLDLVSEPELQGQAEGSAEHVLPSSGPFEFKFTVEVKAEFDLPPYKGLEATRTVDPVGDDEITKVLARLADSRARWMPATDDTCAKEDLVSGRLTLVRDGETILDEDVSFAADDALVGVGLRLTNAVDTLSGKKVGEAVAVKAEIQDTHPKAAWHGATAEGTLAIEEIKRRTTPAIDDDLAKEAGFDDLPAFRADVRSRLQKQHELEADRDVVRQILDALIAAVEIPLPKGLVDRVLVHKVRERALRYQLFEHLPEADALARAEAEKDELRKSVERDHRAWLLIEKIAKKERIFCLEDDVDAEIQRIAAERNEKPSRVREQYEKHGRLAEIRSEVIEQKTCQFLREHATIAGGDGRVAQAAG